MIYHRYIKLKIYREVFFSVRSLPLVDCLQIELLEYSGLYTKVFQHENLVPVSKNILHVEEVCDPKLLL